MKTKTVLHDGSFGIAVAAILQESGILSKHFSCEEWKALRPSDCFSEGDDITAVVLRGPTLQDLRTIADALGNNAWIAVIPFERHLIITPVFGCGRVCPSCFIRRWMSQPPEGYYPEVVNAMVSVVPQVAGFEYVNLSPLAAALAAHALLDSATRNASYAICIDQAGEAVQSAMIRAVHGCGCRPALEGVGGADRFSRFSEEFHDVIRSRTYKADFTHEEEASS